MKNIILILLSIFTLTSCYKTNDWNAHYTNISGEYVIDRVTMLATDQTPLQDGQNFYTGDLVLNSEQTFPLDAIEVGITRWHISNSSICFNPVGTTTGQTIWLDEYVLSRVTNPGGDEILSFNVNGTVKKFIIVDATLESLTLRTTGQWVFGSSGPYETMVIKFSRVGP
jgi:hypothetical protein